MTKSNEGGVRVEREVRPTARWATNCWNRAGTAHLFDFVCEGSHLMEAACGHYRSLLNDLQPEDKATRRCLRCQKIESAQRRVQRTSR